MNEFAFAALVESLSDGVFVVRLPERTIAYANPAALRMFGYGEEELIGHSTRILHVDDARFAAFHLHSSDTLGREPSFRGEFEMRRRDGAVFPTQHTVSLFSDAQGQRFSVSVVRDTTEQKEQERKLRESEHLFRQIAENVREVFWMSDPGKQRTDYVSPAYETIWGRPIRGLYEEPMSFLDAIEAEDRQRVVDALPLQATGEYDIQYRIRRPDGEVRWIWDRCTPVKDEHGRISRIVGIAEDITPLKRHEEQWVQAQKMEAVGRLTGGIAHDFNNMLTVISGNAELLADKVAGEAPLAALAQGVLKASQRAGDLTARLLAFSRRDPVQQENLELTALLRDLSGLLGRTLGEDVRIRITLPDDLWPVATGRAQLEASLINLAVNARDAMPHGGSLLIVGSNLHHPSPESQLPDSLPAGDYVRLSVSDTGLGIAADVLPHVFEPFFTTKEPGKGTGLGLSMVFGFVQEAGGHVEVESSAGEGAAFHLYLPRHEGKPPASPPEPVPAETGGETILLVEDDEMVRALIDTQLQFLGYRVICAADGHEALGILADRSDIDLLLTDVIMPGGLSGPQIALQARRDRPDLPVLFISGYGALQELARANLRDELPVLAKPFRKQDLAEAVVNALTNRPPPAE